MENKYLKFGGFLKFFLIVGHFFVVTFAFQSGNYLYRVLTGDFIAKTWVHIIGLGILSFCFYMFSSQLYEQNKKSPEYVKQWIIYTAIVAFLYNAIEAILFDLNIGNALRPVFYLGILYLYFMKSNRVKVYYEQFEEI